MIRFPNGLPSGFGRGPTWKTVIRDIGTPKILKQKKKPVYIEDGIQKAFVKWFRRQHPRLLLFAIPNEGRRNFAAANRMRALGMMKGVLDLFLAFPCGGYHGLWLETKAPGKPMSPEQRKIAAKLRADGYRVEVYDSLEEGIDYVRAYLQDIKVGLTE